MLVLQITLFRALQSMESLNNKVFIVKKNMSVLFNYFTTLVLCCSNVVKVQSVSLLKHALVFVGLCNRLIAKITYFETIDRLDMRYVHYIPHMPFVP